MTAISSSMIEKRGVGLNELVKVPKWGIKTLIKAKGTGNLAFSL